MASADVSSAQGFAKLASKNALLEAIYASLEPFYASLEAVYFNFFASSGGSRHEVVFEPAV